MNTAAAESEPLITAKKVADLLQVCDRTATRLMQSGEIEGFKVHGKMWRTTASRVEAYKRKQFLNHRTQAAVAGGHRPVYLSRTPPSLT
jgi:excisionase family DNA binding protein